MEIFENATSKDLISEKEEFNKTIQEWLILMMLQKKP